MKHVGVSKLSDMKGQEKTRFIKESVNNAVTAAQLQRSFIHP